MRRHDDSYFWCGLISISLALFLCFATMNDVCFATDKNGVSINKISLPKGPGSLEGLGESFQPNFSTGTAQYAVKLKIPPGPAGSAPEISLRYNSGNGNGVLGFGWCIQIPFVQRRTEKGIPKYIDSNNQLDDDGDGVVDESDEIDVFIDHFGEDLIPQPDGNYFHKNEGAFIRYRRVNNHWEGTLPDGVKMIFGASPQARITDSKNDKIFRWMLEKMIDNSGNTIVYSYRSFEGIENTNQIYLSQIGYGPGESYRKNFHFLFFEYENRNDWFEDCRAGFVVRTGKRIKNIYIATQGIDLKGHVPGDFNHDNEKDFLNRKYELKYTATHHWSLLTSVTLCGADNQSNLPSFKFNYTTCSFPDTISARSATIGSVNTPLQVMDNDLVELLDINADGLPDILKTDLYGGSHRAFLNMGEYNDSNGNKSIQWSPVKYFAGDLKAQNINLQDSKNSIAHLADMNGDGLSDLVYKSLTNDTYFFPNDGNISWGKRSKMNLLPMYSSPPSPFGTKNTKTADISFNKRMDIIQSVKIGSNIHYKIWFNLDNQSYSKHATMSPNSAYMLSDKGIHITDLNGDRVPDIVKVKSTSIEVTAGLGYGQFTPKINISLSEYLNDNQIAAVKFQDISGDGLHDLVVENAEVNSFWYWINLGNYTFDIKRVVTDLPVTYGQQSSIRWVDINGNGTIDFVFADQYASPRIQAVDFGELIGCVPSSNILSGIDNGVGAKTTIDYKTSVHYSLLDAKDNNEWIDPLPFPVHVVSKIIVDDSLGNEYVTLFRYHNGYYDSLEHEFRGFASVDMIESGDASAPTLTTRFVFDTGRTIEAMKGKMLHKTISEYGHPEFFQKETIKWSEPIKLMIGTDYHPVIFIHKKSSTTIVKEKGEGKPQTIHSEFEYDSYGNQTEKREYGIINNNNKQTCNDERITKIQYAYNLSKWLLRYPSSTEIQDYNGDLISKTQIYYDDDQFSATNDGIVTFGKPTLIEKMVTQDRNAKIERIKYDVYGNPVLLLDPLGDPSDIKKGHCREIRYDAYFHTYPISEKIHIGKDISPLIYQVEYDSGFGQIKKSFDFNANSTEFHYDTFGRLQTIIRPGDTTEKPTTTYEYYLAERFDNSFLINFIETHQKDSSPDSKGSFISRTFIDGLGRKLMTKEEAGEWGYAVKNAKWFNVRKKDAGILQPYYSYSFDFENINDENWIGKFHRDGQIVNLNFNMAHKIIINYDAKLRPTRIINPDNTIKENIYEPFITKIYDENDSDPNSPFYETPKIHFKDGLDRLYRIDEIVRLNKDGAASADLNTWTTQYEYRADNSLTKIIDNMGNTKIIEYDAIKRVIFMDDPDKGVMHYQYDDASNLIETTDAKNQTIYRTYDGVNRLKNEEYIDSANIKHETLYYYDHPLPSVDFGNNRSGCSKNTKGKLSYVIDLSGKEYNSYDSRGRLQWVVKQIPGASNGKLISYKTTMFYDSMDRLKQIVYPDNDRCFYIYNTRNLLKQIIGGAAHNKTNNQFIINDFSYSPSGKPTRISYGNGLTTTYHYDSRTRLSKLMTFSTNKPLHSVIDYTYQYDNYFNITKISDQSTKISEQKISDTVNNQFFTYDDLYRINSVQYSNILPSDNVIYGGKISYQFNSIGNMILKHSDIQHEEKGKSVTNIGLMKYSENNAGPHAITSSENEKDKRLFLYDKNGNMVNNDGISYIWDFKNRLIAVESDTSKTTYTYDYNDRRISKKIIKKIDSELDKTNASVTTYINKYFEIREGNQPTKYVFSGDDRIARIIGSLDRSVDRIQRFQLFKGWNLISIALEPHQDDCLLFTNPNDNIEKIYRWSAESSKYEPINNKTKLVAGSILWIKVKKDIAFSILGKYTEPEDSLIIPVGQYLTSPVGLMSMSTFFKKKFQNLRIFSNQTKSWQTSIHHKNISISDFPPFVEIGQPVYFFSTEQTLLELPKSCQRIQYYHTDHIHSSTAITDGNGEVIEKIAYYPFGYPKKNVYTEYSNMIMPAYYQFTGKEFDGESNLHYFEKRYYSSYLGCFIGVDPLVSSKPENFIETPLVFNNYSYANGNPVVFIDKTGECPIVTGAVSGGFEILVQYLDYYLSNNPNKGEFKVNWWKVGLEAGAGAISGGASTLSKLRKAPKLVLKIINKLKTTNLGKIIEEVAGVSLDTFKEYFKLEPDKRSFKRAFSESFSGKVVSNSMKSIELKNIPLNGRNEDFLTKGQETFLEFFNKATELPAQKIRGEGVKEIFEDDKK